MFSLFINRELIVNKSRYYSVLLGNLTLFETLMLKNSLDDFLT
jgi:hypothetical protein